MAAITQLTPMGTPGQRYGSFAGRAAVIEVAYAPPFQLEVTTGRQQLEVTTGDTSLDVTTGRQRLEVS